ncbi:XRE family transcriptional regulator [Streptomyces sp. NPDC088196]|uniref:XRE family transcriptional regulator n=1 Tax=Streptomyces sp. NPDC088196 TaxID=3154868 RepID=UPI00344B9382
MGSIPALVEPAVLQWARESVGLTAVAAARKIQVPDGRVTLWEAGQAAPTISQLKKAATIYKRPMAVFFLAEPPTTFDTLRDFRRHEDAEVGEWSPELHAEYRRAIIQRDQLLELMDLEDEEPRTDWHIPDLPDSDDELASIAREKIIQISPLALPEGRSDPYAHLNMWSTGLEESGILVLTSSGGKVERREMRAFSLYFDQVPVIMVNGADYARGRLFSLLHEYAHLLLHTAGLCDTVTDMRATTPDRKLEARCNAIAAAILMPANAVLRRPEVVSRVNRQELWDYAALRSAAAPFGVSAEAFLRRLASLGRVETKFYHARRKDFLAAYEADELRQKATGGNWYRNTVRDLGKGYVRWVADAHKRRVIDSYTAASYLNVKVGQIERLGRDAALTQGLV